MNYEGKFIKCHKHDNDVFELKFDSKTANALNKATLDEMREAVDLVKKDKQAKGLLLTSGRKEFIMGADITEFLVKFNLPKDQFLEWLQQGNSILSDIEDLNIPTVTAINGFALGGGFEVALSTCFRLATPEVKVGLPETKLGLFPGFGGTVRLSRLAGADNAIEWIASGKQYRAADALAVGAIDGVVDSKDLQSSAMDLLQKAIDGKYPWKARQAQKKSPLKLNPVEAGMVFEGAKAFVAGQAGPHYPAPVKAIEVMQKGAGLERDGAIQIESEGFFQVATTPVAGSLVGLFLGDQYLKRVARKWSKQATQPIQSAAVLGAGIMGGGIAYQSASKKIPIVMKDINVKALDLGLTEATTLLSKLNKRGRMTAEKMALTLTRIRSTLSYEDLKESDIVVEAVIENPKIKKAVLKETEKYVSPNTILASNTSTISITELAKDLERPEKFCGMHFFNPVHKMPLVEVIRGEKSGDEAIAATVAYALAMGKTPIVVNDCPGFLVNRILFPYFGGFLKLLSEGVDYERIDKLMEKFGWPMGPAYLLDVVGIDTAFHAGEVMAKAFPNRMKYDFETAVDLLFKENRWGQKNKKGFYSYALDKKGRLKKSSDPIAKELVNKMVSNVTSDGVTSDNITDDEIIQRLMIPMIVESSLCLQEKIVETPVEVDMGLIYGLGFPPFRGGLLKYADSLGAKNLYDLAQKYSSSLGDLYKPTAQMEDLKNTNKTFHTF